MCPASSWYPVYIKFRQISDNAMPDTSVTMVAPGGGEAALKAVYEGDSDIGVIGGFPLYEALAGSGNWEEAMPNTVRVLYYFVSSVIPIAVQADSDIYSISDFQTVL